MSDTKKKLYKMLATNTIVDSSGLKANCEKLLDEIASAWDAEVQQGQGEPYAVYSNDSTYYLVNTRFHEVLDFSCHATNMGKLRDKKNAEWRAQNPQKRYVVETRVYFDDEEKNKERQYRKRYAIYDNQNKAYIIINHNHVMDYGGTGRPPDYDWYNEEQVNTRCNALNAQHEAEVVEQEKPKLTGRHISLPVTPLMKLIDDYREIKKAIDFANEREE